MAVPETQQFNLRWNNHTSNILQVFLEQYTSELLVDVTLSCQGKFLKAHKMVLSACSPYFQEIFSSHDNAHPIIILNGMKFEDVKAIIDFMYRGEIKVLESELDTLLELAETLQIKGLCHVRSKYDKGDIQDTEEHKPPQAKKLKVSPELWSSEEGDSSAEDAAEDAAILLPPTPSVQSTPTHSPPAVSMVPAVSRPGRCPPAVVRVRLNNNEFNDDDLSSTIKVEPPDIRDIDDDSPDDWESQRLVIDLPVLPPSAMPVMPSSKSIVSKSKAKRLLLQGNLSQRRDNLPPVPVFESKIPRPPNAFMIFANEWRRKLAYQYQSESNKEISVRLGFMWKSLPSDTKEAYYAASRQADLEHKQKYPGYYYSPKEARLRKRMKKRSNSNAIEAMELVRVLMKEDGNNTQAHTSHG